MLSTRDASHLVVFNEMFLERVYDLSEITFQPSHVLDCGAHIGMFSLLAYQRFPTSKFHLFEPNPDNVAVIRKNLERNQLNFTVVEGAVSNCGGVTQFTADSSLGGRIAEDDTSGSSYRVRRINLAEYIASLSADSLVLKIDIEGHEEVLIPAIISSLPRRTSIFFETHSGEHEFDELSEFLKSAGFTLKRNRTRGLYIDSYAERS